MAQRINVLFLMTAASTLIVTQAYWPNCTASQDNALIISTEDSCEVLDPAKWPRSWKGEKNEYKCTKDEVVVFDDNDFQWVCEPVICYDLRDKSRRFNSKCRRCVECEDSKCDRFYIEVQPNQTKECLSKPSPKYHRDCGDHGYNCDCFECKCDEGWISDRSKQTCVKVSKPAVQKGSPQAGGDGGSEAAPLCLACMPTVLIIGVVVAVVIIAIIVCIIVYKRTKKKVIMRANSEEDRRTEKIVAQLKEHLDIELQSRAPFDKKESSKQQCMQLPRDRANSPPHSWLQEHEHGDIFEEVEVVQDNEGRLEGELTLRVGDRIHVTKRDHKWMYGTGYLNGNEYGMFPLHCVVDPEGSPGIQEPHIAPGRVPLQIVGHASPDVVEVTHDYTAQRDDELTLRVGDIIQVVARDPVSMYGTGYLNGEQYGIFPLNYVCEPRGSDPGGSQEDLHESCDEMSHDDDAVRSEETLVEVTHDYTAQKDDELTLRVGDIIQVTAKDPVSNFGTGYLNKAHGIFPLAFVKPCI